MGQEFEKILFVLLGWIKGCRPQLESFLSREMSEWINIVIPRTLKIELQIYFNFSLIIVLKRTISTYYYLFCCFAWFTNWLNKLEYFYTATHLTKLFNRATSLFHWNSNNEHLPLSNFAKSWWNNTISAREFENRVFFVLISFNLFSLKKFFIYCSAKTSQPFFIIKNLLRTLN